jgi:hypothetical protein
MDEMKLQQEPNPHYRWSIRGKTPRVRFERDRVKKISFFGGLSLRDKRVTTHLADKQNSQEMITFLEALLKKYHKEIKEELPDHLKSLEKERRKEERGEEFEYRGLILVTLDGASFHKSKEVREWLRKHYGILELFRFPTYSPNLNPQERVWKALRKHLAKVEGKYNFRDTVDRACRFLLTTRFNYKFV